MGKESLVNHSHFSLFLLYPCRRLKNGGEIVGSLEDMIRAEKGAIIAERSVWQRFFSLKALHGVLMFTSWINIVGRIFASNQSGDFTCHTYPVYKQINTPEGQFASVSDADKRLVELHNPKYARLPWSRSITAWAIALSVGPLLGSALIGFIYRYACTLVWGSRFRDQGSLVSSTGMPTL